ncbi:MAG: ABC transporter permease [Cytophagales bacterium]
MFDFDKWQEIWMTIRKNKLRTFLTMFGVFWGIFMLLLLLGGGSGLRNGVNRDFVNGATNSVYMWSQRTTMPYKGFKPGRYFNFNNSDTEFLRDNINYADVISPRNQLGGFRDANNVTRKNKAGAFSVYGDFPDFLKIKYMVMPEGRFINQLDIEDKRKVCVIGKGVQKILFDENEDPVGDYLKINGVYFKIIGTHKSRAEGDEQDRDQQSIYIPFTTFQNVFNYGDIVGWYAMIPKEGYSSEKLEEDAAAILKERHSVHPEDKRGIGSYNAEEEFTEIQALFTGINTFIWIVGIGTLLAGVIGVSNIMLIIVKERTKEIGIRKSLGATPWSIIALIIQESVFITVIAGYGGLLLGTILVEGINKLIEGQETGMFAHPEIDLQVALTALFVLVIGGAFAGLIPARKAAAVDPIEALRTE